MGISDFGAGIQGELQRMMAERIAAQRYAVDQQHYADSQRQQQFNNNRLTQNDQLQQQLRQDTLNENKRNHDIADQDKRIGLANTLGDQIPEGTFMPPTDPGVGILRTGGRGSLLKEQQERPEVLTGPLLPGDTGAARQQGFIKTPSAKQRDSAASQADKAADNARQDTQASEVGRHNRAMEAKPAGGAQTVVVQTPDGLALADKRTGQTKPITSGDSQVPVPQTQQQKNQSQQFARARPILDAIGELSAKINTAHGAEASVKGWERTLASKVNNDDDVAEYESMISGFTPMIARALGHTGVLTEQDVQSVKALFPRPGDSQSLRNRKIARIEQLVGALEANSGPKKAGAGGDTKTGGPQEGQEGNVGGVPAVWKTVNGKSGWYAK